MNITDVSVVDPRDGSITAHQNLRITKDGRIEHVGASAEPDVGEPVVEGRGRFAVPGYVDLHAHPLNLGDPTAELGLMLAFGITGYRQMSGTTALLRNRPAATPERPALLGLPGAVLTPINAGRAETAVAEVRRQAADGADFIKAALITPEVYFAVQAEADRLGLPVVGHLPGGIDVRAARFRSIEHIGPGFGVLAGCSCHEDDLRAGAVRSPIKAPPFPIPFADRLAGFLLGRIVRNPAQLTSPAGLRATRDAIDSFDEAKARELARHFAAQGIWNCPTLIRIKSQELCDTGDFAADPNLKYVTARERRQWAAAARAFAKKFDAEAHDIFAEQFALQLRLVRILDEEGAPLLAGTDAVGAAWVIAGSSLHEEFDLLAEAGLTPLRILQTTTSDAARFLGRDDRAGTIEAGKEADLVLLDADPTAAVGNLHTVSGVVRAGRFFDTGSLAALKERATGR